MHTDHLYAQSQTSTAAAIPSDNPLLQLSQVHERTSDLCNRVGSLCERLLGTQPANEAKGTAPTEPNPYGGVIGSVVTDTRTLNERLYYAEQALNRLDQIVGPF